MREGFLTLEDSSYMTGPTIHIQVDRRGGMPGRFLVASLVVFLLVHMVMLVHSKMNSYPEIDQQHNLLDQLYLEWIMLR